jgi:hypothetical protein
MVEMRKVLGATTSGVASLAVENDGGAQHEASVVSVAALAQHASSALADGLGAQHALSAFAARPGAQHASGAGGAPFEEQAVPAIACAGLTAQQLEPAGSDTGLTASGFKSMTGF